MRSHRDSHANTGDQLILHPSSRLRSDAVGRGAAAPDSPLAAGHVPHLVHGAVHDADGHLARRQAEVGRARAVRVGEDAHLGAVRGEDVCFRGEGYGRGDDQLLGVEMSAVVQDVGYGSVGGLGW